jgi:uncharacterized protein
MSIRNIFSVFSRGENQILGQVEALLDNSIKTSELLLELLQSLKKYDYDTVNAKYEAIADLKAQVVSDHRALVRQICSGSYFGGIREDLLSLLENIAQIPDSCKGAAGVFHELQMPKDVIDYFFEEDVESFISTSIEVAKTFEDAIKALEKSKEEVLSLTEKVEEQEEDADEIRSKIIQHLFKNEINAKSLDIVLLKDFLVTADNIADYSEDGSDVLQILVAKGYS